MRGLHTFVLLSQLREHIVCERFAGRDLARAGHNHSFFGLIAGRQCRRQLVRFRNQTDMTQQHLGCLEDTGRVRVIRQSLLYHTRRGAMNSFKHRVMVADIGAACRTDAALDLRCFVSDDVAVQIRQDKYLKLASDGRIDQICGHDVDIPVLRGDARIIRGNLMANPRKIAIGLFHDIGFGHDRHIVLAVCLGVCKGCAGDASGARLGGYP